MASTEVTAYFSWHKFPGNRIYKQSRDIEKHLGNKWDSLSSADQEDLLDDWYVDSEIRRIYKDVETDAEFPPSYPKLMIPSGEKIMVDESDLRTWRDAHSGPFSWKSKSQQDLTLQDFEPEYMYKPPTKTKRNKSGNSESETEENVKDNTAPPQFEFKEDSWTADVLAEYRTYLDTPTSRPMSRASSPLEEDNPAFEGSVQDVRGGQSNSECSDSINEQSRSERSTSIVSDSISRTQTPEKSKRTKSPGPKKVTFSKSFSKDDSEDDFETKEKLIDRENKEESQNAFSNPVMVNEWSTFVGQEKQDLSEKEIPEPVTNEPPSMTMDRGVESPSQSVESTPDHTARLLPNKPDIAAAEAEAEEVVFVAVESTGERDKANLRKSGFDFLDDW